MKTSRQPPSNQRGLVLITSLVVLVALTLLGLASIQNTTLEERMAGNLRAESMAFQGAEAALRGAETWLAEQPARPVAKPVTTGGSSPTVRPWEHPETQRTDTTKFWWEEFTPAQWAGGSAYADVYQPKLATTEDGTALPAPRYVIEEMPAVSESLVVGQQQDQLGPSFYQITSRAVAVGGRSEVLLRSTFSRRY